LSDWSGILEPIDLGIDGKSGKWNGVFKRDGNLDKTFDTTKKLWNCFEMVQSPLITRPIVQYNGPKLGNLVTFEYLSNMWFIDKWGYLLMGILGTPIWCY
jgi:hypothetical protein